MTQRTFYRTLNAALCLLCVALFVLLAHAQRDRDTARLQLKQEQAANQQQERWLTEQVRELERERGRAEKMRTRIIRLKCIQSKWEWER